jgi:hypothetical protein
MTSTQTPFTARRLANAGKDAQKGEGQNAPTVQNAQNANKRKKPVTWKDLTIKYMLNGVEGIKADLNESGDPVGALEKMISEMSSNDQDTKELEVLRDFFIDLRSVGTPGRQPVKVGDSREYSVQQAGEEGDLFVRIPVVTLPVQRGAKIVARFTENQIVIDLG